MNNERGTVAMPKIFVDTEKFIELYWTSKDITKVIQDFSKIKPFFVFTQQQIDEFFRNRDAQIDGIINQIENYQFEKTLGSIGIIRKFPKFTKIQKLQSDIKDLKKELIAEFIRIRDNPGDDEIFSFFNGLISDPMALIIRREEEIVRRAHSRKLIGNPPLTKDRSTVGDEINWESLLGTIDDDLIIISNDKTYYKHKTFLIREFEKKNEKKKRKLHIFTEISKVLPLINEQPSTELKQFETEQKKIAKVLMQNIISNKMLDFSAASGSSFDSSNNFVRSFFKMNEFIIPNIGEDYEQDNQFKIIKRSDRE